MKPMNVPAFSLDRQTKTMRTKLLGALENVLDSQQFIGGKFVAAFEKQLAEYLNVKHVISCNSGTDALLMALQAVQPTQFNAHVSSTLLPLLGKIVITTPFSFIASCSEIVALGGNPLFIDIEPGTFNIDPKLLTEWLEQNAELKNSKAIHKQSGMPIVGMIPVDLFGQCADYAALQTIADQWNLWIVEDTAQALGADINGKRAGTFGQVGAISFYPTKNLGAFGDAGCCVTNDDILADRLLQNRHHGRALVGGAYNYVDLGLNSRLDAFQAALLSVKLPHLDDANKRRAEIAERYNAALGAIPFIRVPQQIVGTHVYHQYSIVVQDLGGTSCRDALATCLTERGVQTRIFYPEPLSALRFLQTHPALETTCPLATSVSRSVLALPMWPELEDNEVDYVISCVQEWATEFGKNIASSKQTHVQCL